MKILKDKKQGSWLDVHFDTSDEVYLMVTHGKAEHGPFGSRYMALAPKLAIDLAKQILKKTKNNE